MILKKSVYNIHIDKERDYLIILGNNIQIFDLNKMKIIHKLKMRNPSVAYIDYSRHIIIFCNTTSGILVVNYNNFDIIWETKFDDRQINFENSFYSYKTGSIYNITLHTNILTIINIMTKCFELKTDIYFPDDKQNILVRGSTLRDHMFVMMQDEELVNGRYPLYIYNFNIDTYELGIEKKIPTNLRVLNFQELLFTDYEKIYDFKKSTILAFDFTKIPELSYQPVRKDEKYVYIISKQNYSLTKALIYELDGTFVSEDINKYTSYVKIYKNYKIIGTWEKLIITKILDTV